MANDFEALAVVLHDHFQAVIKVGDVFLFVMQRYNDRVLWHSLLIIDELAGSDVNVL